MFRNKLSPLPKGELKQFDFLFELVQENMGFVPNSMKTMARVPALLASFSSLSAVLLANPEKMSPWTAIKLSIKNLAWSGKFVKSPERVPLYLRNLVSYMSSKAGGCIYCQAHTAEQAFHNGVPEDKIKALWEFETHDAFNDMERAALRFALAAGSHPNQVTNEHFIELRSHFSEAQIVELGGVVSLFGFLNRWNDTFASTLEEAPKAMATKLLSHQGWAVGKHA
jgi:alkylhydroperoxidase family enzyme